MGLWRRLWTLGARGRVADGIDRELREHMEMCIDDAVAAGMSREEAERAARVRFGNPAATRERVLAEDAALGLDSLWRDVQLAMRGFVKSPGFALVAITTLALGIGANTAIFELLDALRMRSLPVERPDELADVRIAGGNKGFGVNDGAFANFTVPMWQVVKEHHDPFSGIFAWKPNGVLLGKPSEARRANGLEVTGNFFNVLGVAPFAGRLIEPQDEGPCQISRVVVSYPFWQSEMGGAPITPQSTLMLDGKPVQVLGVTPPKFFGMVVGDRFDVAYSTCTPKHPRREAFLFSVMGRLKPGWTMEQASGYFGALSPGLFESTAPDGYSANYLKLYKSFRLAAYPAGAGVSYLRRAYSRSLEMLLGITGLVLLIACANLANLLLARASIRQREIAIRMSLGASRGRILRQMLTESSLLALVGAGLGVTLAQPLARLLVRALDASPGDIHLTIAPDWRVLAFAAAVTALTCLLFGTIPALRSTGGDPMRAIRSGERGVMGNRERRPVQRLMVEAQIAVSMVLLVGALLFVHSYRNLTSLDPGMREHGITTGYLGFGLQTEKVKPENLAAYKRQMVEEIQALPGVENAAATTNVPLSPSSWSHEVRVGSKAGGSQFTYVSPSYFATMGIPMVSGRGFTKMDTTDAPLVLIVNQAFLRKYFDGGAGVGQQVHVMPEPQYPERTYTVIGTSADTKYQDIRQETPPEAFVPIDQFPAEAQGPGMAVMMASRDSVAAVAAVRRMVEAKHPGMILQFYDFEEGIRSGLVGERMMAMLSGFFGVLAALLVVVGLHGVLSYLLAQRKNEIGVRIALGASRGQVVALVMRDTAVMLGIGLAVGIVLALSAARGASSMLFGIKAWDPVTLAGAAALMVAVTLVASAIPALRAAHVNPVDSLRAE